MKALFFVALASTSYIGETGIVYFSKTRGGTYEMWKHYYLNVTVPTIQRSNSIHSRQAFFNKFLFTLLSVFAYTSYLNNAYFKNDDGTSMRNLYTQDGEADVQEPAMDAAVQLAFQLSHTDFAKGPPSATGIHQTWDRNTSFRDCKRGMKTVTEAGTETSNPILASNLRAAIKELKSLHGEITITSVVESKIIMAAETLSFVHKGGYVTARKHAIGFEVRYQ